MRRNSFQINAVGMIMAAVTAAAVLSVVQAQVEFERPTNYTYDEPVVFNDWCQQIKDMYGPTCVCTTKICTANGINALDLCHEVNCDPIQGELTCINNVTVETNRVYLKASSIGEEGNYENIQQTVIKDFYVLLDDTSVDTISFRYNANFNQRRTGCEAVFGGINCARCGVCDAPPDDVGEDGIHVHLSPNDIFRGISGQCRYGRGPDIGLFNTCEDGDNPLTNITWRELEIRSEDEKGACPGYAPFVPGNPDGESSEGAAVEPSSSTSISLLSAASFITAAAVLAL